MKKFLLFTIALLLNCIAFSQNIFNDGFEAGNTDQSTTILGWTQITGPTYTSYSWTANSSLTTYNRSPRTGLWDAFLHYSGESWLFRQVTLTSGTAYQFSVWARQDGATLTDATVELKYGTAASIAGMTNLITAATGVGSSYVQVKGTFTPASSGTFYVAIHGNINSTPWYLTIDDVSLDVAAAPNAPPISFTASSVSQTGMTIGWTDNSTNETSFRVYRSTDNITFTQVGSDIPSTSTATTGTLYSQPQTGLVAGVTYYYRVVSTLILESTYLTGNQATLPLVPLTGVKTIDPAGSGPNNYFTFTAAITDLNTNGTAAGGVTFNVASATYTENPPAITATGTIANQIIFQKGGVGANPILAATGGAGTSDFGFCFSGSDYITFDGIDVTATGATLEYGYLIRNGSATDGAQYNTIKNARITLNRTNLLTVGVMQSSSSSYGGGVTPTANSGNNSYNKYYNLTIENSYSGIWLYSYTLTYYDLGNEIGTTGTGSTTIGASTANDIGNGSSTVYGIYAYYQTGLKVFNTEIRNLTGTSTSYVYGLYSYYDQGNSLFFNNKIHDISTTNTTTSPRLYGMYVYYPTLTTNVYNNVVYGFSHALSAASATMIVYGINITGTTTANVYYNTVRMNLSANVTNTAFYNAITNGTVKNNIFSNFSTAGATSKRYSFYASSNPVSTSNNILYIDGAGTNNFVGYGVAADRASLNIFAAVISPAAPSYGFLGGSCNADPNFTGTTDLTFAGSTPARYSGTPIAGITTDFAGTTRGLTRPTIGAYETTQPLNDKSAPVFSNISVTNGITPVVSITLNDNSNSALNSTIRLWYRLSTSVGAFTALDADAKPVGAMNGTYTWNTSVAALPQGVYQFYIAARDDQGAGLGIFTYPMWATTWLGWAAGDPPNFVANPDAAANTSTFVKQANLVAGSYEVGDDQPVLKKLTDVAAQLNSSILQGNVTYELNSTYDGTTGELFPVVFNQYTTSGGNWTVTIRVKGGVSARTTSGNIANQLIRLDGADNITFDGRAGGTGSTIAWNIKNTNVGGYAILLFNDAQSNTIQYCDVVAVNPANPVIFIGGTTGANGNDNNMFLNCNIHDDGTNYPIYGIASQGTTTTLNTWNSGITVSNCNIYNYYLNGGSAVGIYLAAGSTSWTVTGNSFYETATKTPTTAAGFTGILMGSGDGHTVSGNYVGGSGPLCAGMLTFSGTTVANYVYGIRFGTMLLSNANSVQGNTVSNISLGTNPAGAGTILFDGILISSGIVNVGNITPNTVGSGSATGSIVVALGAGAFTSNVLGIDFRSPTGLIQNNIVGGITLSGTTTSAATIAGIYFPPTLAGDVTISGNTIGSATTANSIQAVSAANPPVSIYGIYSLPQGGYGNVTMTNNVVANISNSSTNASSLICGIGSANSYAPTIISQNTVRDLLSTAPNTGTTATASIIGLYSSNAFAGQMVRQNSFFNFTNSTATAAAVITGIYYIGPTTGTNSIERNLIHSFSLSSTSATATLNGIYNAGGLTTLKNNMIRLGITSAGASLTSVSQINGIYENSGINNYYNNSVYVGGTGVVGTTGSTYCFYSTVTTSPRNIVDNIFFNARSGGATGKHYAIRVAGTGVNPAGLTSNYNLLFANGATGGTLGYYNADMLTIAAWKAATGQDMASGNGDPNFINATGTSALVDLHVQNPTPIEAAGIALSSVTDDYDGQTRSSLTPPDVGADAGNFTLGADVFGPNITFTPLGNGGTANRVVSNFATITDNVGVAAGANVPRLYYKKSTDNNAFVGNTSADNGWKYVLASNTTSPYSFTIDYSIINGGSVSPTNIIQYFVVAQDAANNLSSNLQGATASGNPPVTLINGAPASPNSFVIASYILWGTVTVPGTYPTLTGTGGLFEAINNGIIVGNITANITANLTEPGTVALNQFNESPVNSNFTLTIQPDGTTERLISGAVANGMIRLDGADRVFIDGRYNYAGRYLRFRNTNTSNPTFTFLNDATNNTIRNCYIEGANTSTGVVLFSTTTGSVGNSNNAIISNIIRDRSDAAGVPYILLYSAGTSGKENTSLTIDGNEFFNFTNYGIYFTTGTGDGMNISNNSIYQTASRASTFYGINISAGNGHTISGNSFGGSNASRTGAATQTTGAYGMYGIYLSVGMVTPTSVQGNLLSNFGSTGSGVGSNVYGLYIAVGNVNVGTVTGNTFGGGALPSDTIRNGYDNGIIYSVTTGYVNVENNVIGNVAYYNAGGVGTCGMYFSAGILSVKNNIIRDLKSNSTGTGYLYLPVGLYLSTTAPSNIEGNTIFNITNSNPNSGAYTCVGLICAGAWTNATIQKNNIYNIKAIGTGTSTSSPQVYGMYISAGNASYNNNLVSIGLGTNGESRLYGIQDASPGFNNYYFNSINIYGTGAGSNSSYAFLKSTTSTINLKNNILNNARTGGSIKSYAIGALSTTGVGSNYNDLYSASGPLGLWGAADQANIAAWQSASFADATSYSVNPSFFSNTNLHTCQSVLNGAGITIPGITTDYAGVTRGNPPDIGAYEFSVPVPTITGGTTFCQNSTGNVYTTESGMAGYAWTVTGGTITSGGTSSDNTATVTWTTAGAQSVSVNYFNANGCAAPTPTVKNVTVDPASVGGSIAGGTNVCTGTNSTLLTLSGYTGTITKWQSSVDNWVTPVDIANTTTTYTATNLTTTTKYRAVITSGVCSSANSADATVAVDPVSVGGSIAGSATVCSGTNSTLLTLSGYTGSIVKWQKSTDNWVTPVDIGNTVATYTVTNISTTTKYRAVIQSGACSSTNSADATVTVDPVSVGGSIAGSATVCAGANSTLLTLSGYTGNIVKWQKSTDNWVTPVDIVNTTTTYTATNLAVTTKYRAVIQSGVCSTANSGDGTVTVNPLPVPTVSGPATCISGTSGNVYTTEAGMTGYTWGISGGGTIDAGQGTNSISVTWNAAGAQLVSVTYTNGNSCSAATPTIYPVNVTSLPGPAGPITGTATVCQGQSSVAYSVAAVVNATTYVWTLPTGATIATGTGTNSITVNYSGTASSGNMSVYGSNGLGDGTPSPNYAVTVKTMPTPTISGPATICAGTAGNVYTTEAGMTAYTWTVSAGGTITAGAGTNSITVTWSTAGAQTVSANYNNANGCPAATATIKNITVNALPVPTITGPATACAASAGNVYTTQAGMTGYTWSVSAGGTITAGAGTNSVTVTWNTAGAQTVSVNYTNANSCTAASATVYNVTVNALPVPTITGPASVCATTTGNVYTTQAGMTGYVWAVSAGGTVTAGAGTNAITVTWNTAGAQTVSVNYTNASNCAATSATVYNVTVNALPVPTITGPASVCAGSTGNVYTTQAGMTGYTWVVSAGGTITAGSGTNAITVTWSTAGAKTVTVNYTNASSCTAASATVYNVTVNTLPVPTITGPASVCVTSTGNVYTTQAAMTGYTWTVSAGGTITAGAGTNAITVTWTTAGAQTVSVNYTNASSCTAASATVYNVTVNALPVPAITGPATVCVATAGNVYTTQASMTGYTWTVSAGGTITAGAGTNAITVTWNTFGAQSVSVNYTNASSCTAASATVYAVTVNTRPVPTITGPATVCSGITGSLYTTQAGMTGYTWTVSAGGTITAGAGTNAITVTWTTAGAQSVTVNYNNASGCNATTPTSFAVTVNATPVPTITGPAAACLNSVGNIYSTQAGMTGYTWTISAGGTITAGAGTSAITVTWNSVGAQTVSVNYTNGSGCTGAAPTVYNVTVNGLAAPTITGSNNLCVNSGYYNYTTEAGMVGYTWTVSAGGTITWGAGTNQIQVVWNTAGAQSVSVIYSNASGCTPVAPTVLAVTVNPMPGAAGNITGTAAVCGGAQGVAYSVAPVPNAANYVWNLPAGATIATGFNSNNITVNFAANASSGNITAQGNNLCGNGAPSPPFAVTVTALPGAAGTITGQAAVCQGTTGVVYSVGTIANATSYTWTVPTGATIVSGATTNSITVNFGLTATSGNVTVLGTNSCGSGTVSPPFAVTVNVKPATPVVTASNDTLTSSIATGNQWYFSATQTGTGAIIPGATGQTHVATQTGWYWSVVTLNGCSSDPSNREYVVMVGEEELQAGTFNIYPVPNDGRFTVSITTPQEKRFTILVYNKLGQMIYELKDVVVTGEFRQLVDLRPTPNGVYTVLFQNDEHKVVRKVLVNK